MPIFKKKHKKTETKEWLSSTNEGELTIDAYETKNDFVIVSTIAGVNAKDIDISIEDDMLIIKGKREKPKNSDKERTYFQKECFWGPFSKKIILPEKVKIAKAKAIIKDGILTLKVPKSKIKSSKKIKIEDE
jgi:HSP20 family protein